MLLSKHLRVLFKGLTGNSSWWLLRPRHSQQILATACIKVQGCPPHTGLLHHQHLSLFELWCSRRGDGEPHWPRHELLERPDLCPALLSSTKSLAQSKPDTPSKQQSNHHRCNRGGARRQERTPGNRKSRKAWTQNDPACINLSTYTDMPKLIHRQQVTVRRLGQMTCRHGKGNAGMPKPAREIPSR